MIGSFLLSSCGGGGGEPLGGAGSTTNGGSQGSVGNAGGPEGVGTQQIDQLFGKHGGTVSPFGDCEDVAQSVALQSDQKIIVAGQTEDCGGDTQVAVARYQPDGTLDTTFGAAQTGRVRFSMLGGVFDTAYAVSVQAGGKIVIAGKATDAGGRAHFALARLDSGGTLDASFGTGGIVTSAVGGADSGIRALALQGDGKIVVAGFAGTDDTDDRNDTYALARYNTSGTLDTTFGTAGMRIQPIDASHGGQVYAMALQPDGRIVITGSAVETSAGGMGKLGLARFEANGVLDTSLGSGGVLVAPIGAGSSTMQALALQQDGKIIVGGSARKPGNTTDDDFVVLRYFANGLIDTDFGSDGMAFTAIGTGEDQVNALQVSSSGKIVAAGTAQQENLDVAVVVYLQNGAPDALFGASGLVRTPIGNGDDEAHAVVLQSDGKIVVAGSAETETSLNDFVVVRYHRP